MKRKPAILVFVVLGGAALALIVLRRHPPAPPPVILHPTPQRLAQAQRHLEALQTEALQPDTLAAEAVHLEAPPTPSTQALRRHGAASVRRPALRTLHISEEDLNVYLAGNQATRKLLGAHGVKAVQLVLNEPAHLTIHASVALRGRAQNVQLDGSLTPDPQTGLRFTATHAQVGRFPMPPAVVTAQANAIAARLLKKVHGRLPLAIRSVQVQGKTLVLTGVLVRSHPAPRQAPPGKAASPRLMLPARRLPLPPASPPQIRPS